MTKSAARARRFRFRLAHKVLIGYLIVTLIMALYAVGVSLYTDIVKDSTAALMTDSQQVVSLSYEMENAVLKMSDGHRGFILTGNELYLDPYTQANNRIGDILKDLMSRRQENPDQKSRLTAITQDMATWKTQADKQISDRRTATDMTEYLRGLSLVQSYDTFTRVSQNMLAFRQVETEAMTKAVAVNTTKINYLQISTAALPVVTLIVGFFAVGTVTRSITKRLQVVEQAAERIAAGDMTGADLKVKGSDEAASLAVAFNSLRSNLRTLIGMTHQAATETYAAAEALIQMSNQATESSNQIAAEMSVLSDGSQHQSHAVAETSRVVGDLSQAVAQIAAGAQQQSEAMTQVSEQFRVMAVAIDSVADQAGAVAEVSRQANRLTQEGSDSVVATVEGMARIKQSSQLAAENVADLSRQLQEIEALVGGIQAIAAQTNMLALNAAIEAARAGEAGRGFAVVAEQVRKLAEDSRGAAQQIQGLAAGIRQGSNQVVVAIAAAEDQAEAGVELAQGAAATLERIKQAVDRTAGAAHAIAGAVTELRRRSSEVTEGIGSTAAVTEENTAATEEMAAGADAAMQHLGQVSELTGQSAASASQVSAATEQLSANSVEVSRAAQTLADTAQRLTEAINRFKI